jgi:hypothetical protein
MSPACGHDNCGSNGDGKLLRGLKHWIGMRKGKDSSQRYKDVVKIGSAPCLRVCSACRTVDGTDLCTLPECCKVDILWAHLGLSIQL